VTFEVNATACCSIFQLELFLPIGQNHVTFSPANAGDYDVIVTDISGSVTSRVAHLYNDLTIDAKRPIQWGKQL
jgi:hypothetical protein